MSSDFPLTCPGCFCVKPSPENWCHAIARVVRPEQVRHLLLPLSNPPPNWSSAANVAAHMRRRFERGALRYIADPAGCDLWGPPRATLMRGGGDCDDLSAYALSLLHAMGKDADMMVGVLCSPGRCEGHAWVEGHDEQGHFVLEATSGHLYRSGRPPGYSAQYQLRPGRCLDVRDLHTRLTAIVANSVVPCQPRVVLQRCEWT